MSSYVLKLLSVLLLSSATVLGDSIYQRRTAQSCGKCLDPVIVPIAVTASNAIINMTTPKNQQQFTDFVTRWTSLTSNTTADFVKAATVANVNATYNIWTQLCVPTKPDGTATVELAVHGIGFDHSYWNFGGPGAKTNYVEASLKAGHSILIYDRLGVGKSSKPNGITEVQTGAQVEIVAGLVNYLRNKPQSQNFKHVVGVGHSYGSAQLLGLIAKYGNVIDAVVLTGFSTFGNAFAQVMASFSWTIAAQQNSLRFGSLPFTYVASQSVINDQLNFFRYPNYDPAALQAATTNKATATIGELLTQGGVPAFNYTNPAFIVTGDKDIIFCGGNCYQTGALGTDLISSTRVVFPNVTDYSTYIPADTGHGLNMHLSAPDSFSKIQEWLASRITA